MRAKIIFSAIAAAALLLATPLELLAQRFSIGPGGFSIGSGRSGISIGAGGYDRGYRYGRGYPGRYGYGGWDYDDDDYGYYGGDRYYVQPRMQYSYPVQMPYEGPGVAIRNNTDVELNFTIDGARPMHIAPGETMRLVEKRQFTIAFDRGSDFGSTRYTIHEGLYEFTPTDNGWELFRQKADDSVATERNPDATPRTAERPRRDIPPEEDRPMKDRDIDDRPTDELPREVPEELPPPRTNPY
jgi:hypothetical protein